MNAQEIKSKYCIEYNPILGKEFSGGRKEFDNEVKKTIKDSVDVGDIAVKVSGNEKAVKRIAMEKLFNEFSTLPKSWKAVKKGDTIMIRTDRNGKLHDVVKIEYFNPQTVSMTPYKGAPVLKSFKDAFVYVPKLGVEGRRNLNDSVNPFEKWDKNPDKVMKFPNKKNDAEKEFWNKWVKSCISNFKNFVNNDSPMVPMIDSRIKDPKKLKIIQELSNIQRKYEDISHKARSILTKAESQL